MDSPESTERQDDGFSAARDYADLAETAEEEEIDLGGRDKNIQFRMGYELVEDRSRDGWTIQILYDPQAGKEERPYYRRDEPGRPLPEYHMSEHDKEAVKHGLEVLRETLETSAPSALPTHVLFPETGARPLKEAVQPVIDAVLSRAGKQTPDYDHIVINARAHTALREGLYASWVKDQIEADDANQSEALRSKIRQLVQETGLNNASHVLVVDDVASRVRGSARLLSEVIHQELPDAEVRFFAFFGDTEDSEAGASGLNTIVAGEDHRKNRLGARKGFDYTAWDELKEQVVGARKVSGLGTPTHVEELNANKGEYNPQVVADFKTEMHQLGESVAQRPA